MMKKILSISFVLILLSGCNAAPSKPSLNALNIEVSQYLKSLSEKEFDEVVSEYAVEFANGLKEYRHQYERLDHATYDPEYDTIELHIVQNLDKVTKDSQVSGPYGADADFRKESKVAVNVWGNARRVYALELLYKVTVGQGECRDFENGKFEWVSKYVSVR